MNSITFPLSSSASIDRLYLGDNGMLYCNHIDPNNNNGVNDNDQSQSGISDPISINNLHSIRELCLQMRRTIPSQRQLALRVWKRVFQRLSSNMTSVYQDTEEINLFRSILQEDFILHFLRSSIDDSYRSVLTEAIMMMANLFDWILGKLDSSTCTTITIWNNNDSPNQKFRLAIISKLIRMDILQRWRYLLERNRDDGNENEIIMMTHAIIDILWRVAKFSTDWTNEIVRCPRMMNALCETLLAEQNEVYLQRCIDIIVKLLHHVNGEGRDESISVSLMNIFIKYDCIQRLIEHGRSAKVSSKYDQISSSHFNESLSYLLRMSIKVDPNIGLQWLDYVIALTNDHLKAGLVPETIWNCLDYLTRVHLLVPSSSSQSHLLETLHPIAVQSLDWLNHVDYSMEFPIDILIAIQSLLFFLINYRNVGGHIEPPTEETIIRLYQYCSSRLHIVSDDSNDAESTHIVQLYRILTLLFEVDREFSSAINSISPSISKTTFWTSQHIYADEVNRLLDETIIKLEEIVFTSSKIDYRTERRWCMWDFSYQALEWLSRHDDLLSPKKRVIMTVRLLNLIDRLFSAIALPTEKTLYERKIDSLISKTLLHCDSLETILHLDLSHVRTLIELVNPLFHPDLSGRPEEIDSFSRNVAVPMISWLWRPMDLLNHKYQRDKLSFSFADTTTISLAWLEFLEKLDSFIIPLVSGSTAERRILMLMNLCLLPGDVFLDELVSGSMRRFLERTVKHSLSTINRPWNLTNPDNLSLDPPNELITRFSEFYALFLDHFQANSYGNLLFTNLVLLPCTSIHVPDYRFSLLSLPPLSIASLLRIAPEQLVASQATLKCFIDPIESDSRVIRQFARLMLHPRISMERTPFVYLWCMHHLQQRFLLVDIHLSNTSHDESNDKQDEQIFFRGFLLTLLKFLPEKFRDFIEFDCLKRFSHLGWSKSELGMEPNFLTIPDRVRSLLSGSDETEFVETVLTSLSLGKP